MSSAILNVTFDCADPRALARFWGEATGWPVIEEPQPGSEESAVGNPGQGRPRLDFVRVPEDKTIRDRVHLDVMPDDRTRYDEEIARLTRLGSTVPQRPAPRVRLGAPRRS